MLKKFNYRRRPSQGKLDGTLERLRSEYLSDRDSMLLICPMGLGDTYFTCSLAAAMLARRGKRKLVILTKPNQLFIPRIFSDKWEVQTIPEWLNVDEVKKTLPLPDDIVYGHFQTSEAVNLLGFKGLTLLDGHRSILNLPVNEKMDKPLKISEQSRAAAKSFLQATNINSDKSVILAPEAVSLDNIDPAFWVELSGRLRSDGWGVILNASEKFAKLIPHDTNSFHIESSVIPALAEEVEWVVSIRSGLCDILSWTNCQLTVIYPKIPWHGGTMLEATSLKAMGISKTADEIEFNNIDKTIQLALSSGKKRQK